MTRRGAIAVLISTTALAPGLVGPTASPEARAAQTGCPGQGRANAAPAVQEEAMLCLVNRARGARGLEPLRALASLQRAAGRKSGDLLRCDEFSHEACGRPFVYWMDHLGYRGCAEGENIAWASAGYATPRAIFGMWMRSQGHRENILGPYLDTGLGLEVGTLEGFHGAHVWTEEFGSREC